MNIETIREFIDPQLLIVVPMLWGIGMAVKKSSIENKFIPFILLVCSCAVVMLHLTGTNLILDSQALAGCVFAGMTQGSVIWLLAWMGYEKMLKESEIR
ncbi:MAG: hypothetical protein IKU54_03890 [Oscillospiraceae bacterium]|nr:hypothetical protein [Oscillospiraceae bacterium]